MNGKSSMLVFSFVFGVAYTFFVYNNLALFRFYPAYSQFAMAPLGPEAGPAILWYGWLANALLVSLAAAVIVPRVLAARVSPTLVSGVSVGVLVVIIFLLRAWFI